MKTLDAFRGHGMDWWSVKRHIEERTQELDNYLNEIKTEDAA